MKHEDKIEILAQLRHIATDYTGAMAALHTRVKYNTASPATLVQELNDAKAALAEQQRLIEGLLGRLEGN